MATVRVRSRRTGPLARAQNRRTHPKAYLATDTGLKCILPIAPAEVDHDGYADPLDVLEREGRKPVVARRGDQLRRVSFDLFLASQTLGQSVQRFLNELEAIAGSAARVTFSYGTSERGTWLVERYSFTVTERVPYSNDAAKAVATLSLVEASDVVVKVGPLTGGKPLPKRPTGKPSAAVRTHVVVRGDTLAALAVRFYGTAAAWPTLAKVNGVRDPRRLAVGTKLKVPSVLVGGTGK